MQGNEILHKERTSRKESLVGQTLCVAAIRIRAKKKQSAWRIA
jgi:hypothetical protein